MVQHNKQITTDCWPEKAQYIVGEVVTLKMIRPIQIKTLPNICLFRLADIFPAEPIWNQTSSQKDAEILTASFSQLPAGYYGVEISWGDTILSTAFDITKDRRQDVRYGFISDFKQSDCGEEDILFANKLHLNAIQFYDWMYRHDNLVSKVELYNDPMGRETSLSTIRTKILACKKYGIRPFAYGAIYAATQELYNQHPEWALYTIDGVPMKFADWLYFMNTSENCPWSNYIVEQYENSISELGFQGIHMDTYGFPKHVLDNNGSAVALEKTFPSLIERSACAVKEIDCEAGVIFNAVNNWPIEEVAPTNQDAVYIEVWPPHDTYFELYRLIREAKQIAQKPVVLAAYMKPFLGAETNESITAAETSLLLTFAVINASGGRQLVFGENKGILCDSYYANYAVIRDSFLSVVRNYCDFAVRYSPLLEYNSAVDISMTAANGINEDILFHAKEDIRFSSNAQADTVWTIIREYEERLVIHLINLSGITQQWNEPKLQRPNSVQDIEIKLLINHRFSNIYVASPDFQGGTAQILEYRKETQNNGQYVFIKVPNLEIWDTVWIELIQ
ncbi:glycoside hydrolase family 66 protein [Paludicola sp. MB14-C6]|uniref:glycoside hydrolase family 66 protein n=1 Tax=Paludihabitans sp. MB14-C6 TaxID=3070656 RepID=UPI0027DBF1C4|nr:glycoside hydrolase family 66 protein [Paludicola sp. MB14-C6]WMJ22506.1 glycoside hydrolase family 66 protein [Paludicola sp. MB14-C6]